MFQKIKKLIFNKLLFNLAYVQLYENKIVARDVDTGKEVSQISIDPFSHKRSILGNFAIAENLLTESLKQIYEGSWFSPSPIMIIHPMELIDDGLTQIEVRALAELGAGAGARKVFVYTGDELTNIELQGDLKRIKFLSASTCS